jgi:hypothetical protein
VPESPARSECDFRVVGESIATLDHHKVAGMDTLRDLDLSIDNRGMRLSRKRIR